MPEYFVTKKIAVFLAIMAFLEGEELLVQGMRFKVEKSLLPGPDFPLAGLPLFDEHTKGWRILEHRFVLKFQLRCILMGAPCDVIGRWLKPRIEKVLLENKCELCTPSQMKLVKEWVNAFVERYPEFWRAGLAKYAENLGIPLQPDERRRMIRVLGTYP